MSTLMMSDDNSESETVKLKDDKLKNKRKGEGEDGRVNSGEDQ